MHRVNQYKFCEREISFQGGGSVKEVKNLDYKRVCDVSTDKRVVEILKKDCITKIVANPNGTLNITHKRIISTV